MRGRRAGLALLVLVCLLPLALTVRPHFKLSHDAATYALLADSLAAGQGYTYHGYPHVKYPPGYPATLALVRRLGGRSHLAARLAMAILGALSLLAAWRLVARRHGEALGLGALVAMAWTGFLVEHAAYTLTDVPFLGLLALACLAGESLVRKGGVSRALSTGLLIALAASFRTVGILLLPALVLAWFTRRRGTDETDRRALLPLLLVVGFVLIPLGSWVYYQKTATPRISEDLREGATYSGELFEGKLWLDAPTGIGNLGHQLLIRPVILCGTAARFFTGNRIGWPDQGWWVKQGGPLSILAVLLLLALAGWTFWRHRGLLDWFFFIYLAVLMVTPPFVGPRYFIPLLPFLYGGLLAAGAALGKGLGRARGRRAALVGGPLLVVLLWTLPSGRVTAVTGEISTVDVIRRERREPYYQGHEAAFVKCLDRLATGPETVIVANEAALVSYLAGRIAWGFPLPRVEEGSGSEELGPQERQRQRVEQQVKVVAAYLQERADQVLVSTWGYPVYEGLLQLAVRRLVEAGRLEPWFQEADPGAGVLSVLLRRPEKKGGG